MLHDLLLENVFGKEVSAMTILLLWLFHPARRFDLTVKWMSVGDMITYYSNKDKASMLALLEMVQRGHLWPPRETV